MNETISRIEAKLLDKEVEAFRKELSRGADIIVNAIAALYDSKCDKNPMYKGDKTKDLNELISRLIYSKTSYYGGEYTYVSKNTKVEVPDFIKEILLKAAIEKFMNDIENINSVVG